MANWDILKKAISDVVKTNDNREITGASLQSVLHSIVSNVGANATFAGIATPSTNPSTHDGPVFYLASTSGVYTNFSSITVTSSEIAILTWDNGVWKKQSMPLSTNGSIISVHRADVSINENVVTLGAGNYYFYKHDGVERNKNLGSPLTFTFSADKVLTFNLSSLSFQFHDKNETSSDEVILLIWDNVKGFANNYGTLWGNKIDNARINEIEQKIGNSSSVPSFVKNEANTTYSRLLDFLSGDSADLIGMITDVHSYKTDKYKYCHYLSEINKLFGCSVLVNCGDIGLTSSSTLEEAKALIANTIMSMDNSSHWIFCKGNHDNAVAQLHVSAVSNAINTVYKRQFFCSSTTENNTENTDFGCVKNTNMGSVYIYLNTTDDTIPGRSTYFIGEAQLLWLINTLKSVPAQTRVVICMHRCPEHFADWNSYASDIVGYSWDAIRAIFPDFVSKSSGSNSDLGISWDFRNSPTSAKLVCVLCGDSHFNAFQKINGVNYIVRQGYGGIAASEMPASAVKDDFDHNEQCLLDILAIKSNGTAKMFRIGAGGESRDLTISY